MKKIHIVLFLLIFTFFVNEVFIFGQSNRLGNEYDPNYKEYNKAIGNLEKSYTSTIDANEAYDKPVEGKLLNYYRNELTSNPGEDLESRIADLQNVLDKTTDMFCTVDEDVLNDQLVDLNLAFTQLKSSPNPPANLGNEINSKEQALRQNIIKAIDSVLKSNGACKSNPNPSEIMGLKDY